MAAVAGYPRRRDRVPIAAAPEGKGKEAGEEEKLTRGRFCAFVGEEKQPVVGFDGEQELRRRSQWWLAAGRSIPGLGEGLRRWRTKWSGSGHGESKRDGGGWPEQRLQWLCSVRAQLELDGEERKGKNG